MTAYKLIQVPLRCPSCHSPTLSTSDDMNSDMICESCGNRYPISFGRPVLLRPDNEVFCIDDYRHAAAPVLSNNKGNAWWRLIPKPSVNLASQRMLSRLRELLEKKPLAIVLVVDGGCQRRWLNERLGAGDFLRLVYSDIDASADIDLFCDGHDLPFEDAVFDAVVTTAVLEHVLYPERVAAEITRVLKEGGLLYSELPFMQQVHEGAYDFTRYTLSGHRRLFNGISEIDSGIWRGLVQHWCGQ